MVQIKNLQEHVALAEFTTMKVGGPADYFVVLRVREDAAEACDWASENGRGVFVLGEGSNVVIGDGPIRDVVLKNEISGFEVVAEDAQSVTLKIGGGENWDSVVERTVNMGLSGIEAMSAIPGTAGAAPVQNAGAYGQEIADTLVELDAYDRQAHGFVVLQRGDCGFAYRTSMFKTTGKGRYVITSVTLKLAKGAPGAATYESLKRYLAEHKIDHPSVKQVREAVIAVRTRVLPDPKVVPNSGSFFKNPVVDGAELARLRKEFGEVPSFKYGDKFKVAAGWIVEQCGFKGQEHYGLVMHDRHALIITNPNHAGYADLKKLVDLIVSTAQKKFGITLEPEPQFVN